MPLKLYHVLPRADHPGSHNALKVAILLRELGAQEGTDWQVIDCDPETELRPANAPMRALNPNGRTPVIDDDGFILWESSAVLQYLAVTHPAGANYYPQDVRQRALVWQWLGWDAATLTPALMNAFFASEAQRPTALDALGGALTILNRQLRDREFVLGNYSLADIALGCITCAVFMTGIDMHDQPEILRWLGTLAGRDAWQDPIFLNDIKSARDQGYAL